MPKRLFLAVEAGNESDARSVVERFFSIPMTHLAEYPDYEVVEFRRAADDTGQMNPVVEEDILGVVAKKDKMIADGLGDIARCFSEPARVVDALSGDDDPTAFLSKMWFEGFATQGRSLSAHHNGFFVYEAELALERVSVALKLMGAGFHVDVGFWDVEQYTSTLDGLYDRVRFAPNRQWVATVDVIIKDNPYVVRAKLKERERELETQISVLAEYVRDLCIESHSAPFQACERCAPLLNKADALAQDKGL